MSDHGYGAYSRGCRCEICREAKRVYVRERRAAGVEIDHRARHDRNHRVRRQPYDQTPARAHLARLMDEFGWNINGIAIAAGVDCGTIRRALDGRTFRRNTGHLILSVLPVPYVRPNVTRVTRRCASCGNAFTAVPSDARRHCNMTCAGRARAGMPSHQHPLWSDVDLIRCLIRASENGVVTTNSYNKWRARNDGPTIKTIVDRIGPTWAAAVARAGLRPGQARRTYTRRWDEAAIKTILRAAFGEGVVTSDDYDRWARGRDVPSFALVRMRFGRWSHAVALATASESMPA